MIELLDGLVHTSRLMSVPLPRGRASRHTLVRTLIASNYVALPTALRATLEAAESCVCLLEAPCPASGMMASPVLPFTFSLELEFACSMLQNNETAI